MKENRYNHLVKNTLVFAIGSFGSKVLSFLIIPLYTHTLSTSEYGRIDLLTTTINLFLPFTTLLIQEAVLRFLVAKEISKRDALQCSMQVFILGSIMTILLSPISKKIFGFKDLFIIYQILLIINTYTSIFSQYLISIGKNFEFSLGGIFVTLITVALNLIFLVRLKMGLPGYLLSLLVAQLFSAIYSTIIGGVFKDFGKVFSIDFSVMYKLLKYSIPLIPNGLMWWIMNAGDKYVINYFLGDDVNGLYAIAMKFPTLINMIYSIFSQAWQLSAIEESTSLEKNQFYSNVFQVTVGLLLICTSGIVFICEPVYKNIIEHSYYIAWKYVPLLSLAMVFNALSTFMGIVYVISKKSHKAFITTFEGAVFNIIFNFLFIQKLELYGVAIGTCLGYLVVFIIRMRAFNLYMGTPIKLRKLWIGVFILLCQIILTTYFVGYFRVFINIGSILGIILLERKEMQLFIWKCKKERL